MLKACLMHRPRLLPARAGDALNSIELVSASWVGTGSPARAVSASCRPSDARTYGDYYQFFKDRRHCVRRFRCRDPELTQSRADRFASWWFQRLASRRGPRGAAPVQGRARLVAVPDAAWSPSGCFGVFHPERTPSIRRLGERQEVFSPPAPASRCRVSPEPLVYVRSPSSRPARP